MIEKLINLKAEEKKDIFNWDDILAIPEFEVLDHTEQSKKWHGEGNVWQHTMQVCAFAEDYCYTVGITGDCYDRKVLLTAALFHDIGKGITTTFTNDWHSYGHEIAGEKITRKLLWNESVRFREDVCALVRWHMTPLEMIKDKYIPNAIASMSKNVPSLKLLFALKWCDLEGSRPADSVFKNFNFNIIRSLRNWAFEMGCFTKPSTIPTKGQIPDVEFDRQKNTSKPVAVVNLMIGLPGAGKSTIIKDVTRDMDKNKYTIISRDIVRHELGFCGENEKIVGTNEQENQVTKKINEEILSAAKNGKLIFIDNINIKKKYRDEFKNLLKDYSVIWHYIYVEAKGIEKNTKRRDGQISGTVLEGMINNIEWPLREEYDNLEIFEN